MKTQQYVCLLRGINVGGNNKIKMAELKELLTKIGLEDVVTYIQSGNIVFRAAVQQAEQLSERIREEILKHFGFEIKVLTIGEADFRQYVQESPYAKDKMEEIKMLHVTILNDSPKAEQIPLLEARKQAGEEFTIIGNRVYLYFANGGYGRTKISNNDIERIFKVNGTTRNWRTMLKLESLLGE